MPTRRHTSMAPPTASAKSRGVQTVSVAGGHARGSATHATLERRLAHDFRSVRVVGAAPSLVQRAPAPAPAPSSSSAADVPIRVSGDVQGETFLYVVNTAKFRRGEEQRLRSFATFIPNDAALGVHGFASEDGPAALNERLSSERAVKAKATLIDAGLPATQISGLFAHGATPGNRAAHRSAVIDLQPPAAAAPAPRTLGADTTSALDHLYRLGAKAATESGGPDFQKAVNAFKVQLETDLKAVPDGTPLPNDLQIVVRALLLWDVDKGKQWGEGSLDSTDFTPSAAAYAVVPAAQNKCNAFLGEVVYRATGVVHRGHLKEGKAASDPRAWFPFRASEWGDASFSIPHFPPITGSPMRGDILCTGGHVGIYLGNYAGKDLYISARDDAVGVLGLGEQFTHGIQIKYTKPGIYRRYKP